MLIVSYGFLGIGALFASFLAFYWLGVSKKRCVILSLIAGGICSLVVCLNMSVRISTLLCLVFLVIYIPLIMQPEGTMPDAIAAVSIACACYGMIQVTVKVILWIELLSFFFRFMMIVICLAGFCAAVRAVSEGFPGSSWQEYFRESGQSDGELNQMLTGICGYFVSYGICLSIPALMSSFPWPVLFLEWFGFFGGLILINLTISNRQEEKTALAEKQYREDLQTYMSVIRSQRHDYNFHVQTLHGLLLRKDYMACEKYLNELLKDSIEMNQILPLHDAAVSALILSFRSKAAQSGIHMEIDIENDLSQVATNVYETNKVIGNLLQNAIDETDMLADKSYGIRLSIIKRGEFCIINVSNRVRTAKPMAGYQVGSSSKKGHEGIGLASVQALVSRYGGVVYSRMEKDIIFFIAKIPLRLVKGES